MKGYNFTDRARKVLQLAREEATRLHHDRVGPEHVLLGILGEGEGVACAVLGVLQVDAKELHKKVEASVRAGTASAQVGVDLPYTSRAKKVLESAMSEARDLGHSYVGTEHLLLGLAHLRSGATTLLARSGVTLERARDAVVRLVSDDQHSAPNPEPENETRQSNDVIGFFRKPIVGIIGTVASVLGLVLAVYFFASGRRYRQLVYLVNPSKAIVLRAGQTSRLHITMGTSIVNSDVTAAQIAVWNQGRESIRSPNMLRPLVLLTGAAHPIVEATIRKVSRDVVGLKLDTAKTSAGELRVGWDILEHNDGAVIQVIYFGDAEVPITATGTIEGQGEVRALTSRSKVSGSEKYSDESVAIRIIALAYLLVGVICTPVGISLVRGRGSARVTIRLAHSLRVSVPRSFAVLLPVSMIITSLAMLYWVATWPAPPFGF